MMEQVSSFGSSIFTSWNLRARAGSFSKYLRYSDQVVAARVRSSPRASAGLRRLAASPWPAEPPAPMSVCASSMNSIVGVGLFLIASITFFRRFSNSPLTDAPAWRSPRSRPHKSTLRKWSGTSLLAIRKASPSTMAVFPTPASPTRMGLFFLRRLRMSSACRISLSRPKIGSILPSRANWVKFVQNWVSTSAWPAPPPDRLFVPAAGCFPVCSIEAWTILKYWSFRFSRLIPRSRSA